MANLAIGRMVLGMFETNCYFIYDKDTKKALVFDPGKGGKPGIRGFIVYRPAK